MKNWMIELEKAVGTESTHLTVNTLSVCFTVMTILAGNWHLLV